jgi:hypothetical protein
MASAAGEIFDEHDGDAMAIAELLVQERAENEGLREQAANAAAEALVRQTTLKGMSVEDGATLLELGPPRELVIAYVDAARKLLGDAPNYSETRIDFPAVSMEFKAAGEFERYILTVQRAGKVTPHDARRKAEAERDWLSAALREMARRSVASRIEARAWRDLLAKESAEGDELRARDEAAKTVEQSWGNPIGPAAGTFSARSIVEHQWPGLPAALDALARAHEDGGQDR